MDGTFGLVINAPTSLLSQVRLCAGDRPAWLRVEAARELAHLTELSPELQRTAAITDQLISTLEEFLDFKPEEGEVSPRPEHLSPSVSCKLEDLYLLLLIDTVH